MIRSFWSIACGLLLLAAGPASADGIDCAKAKAPADRAVCADPALTALDGKIARQYAKVRAALADDGLRHDLVQGQRAWIAGRDAACPDAEPECLKAHYAARLDDLTALAAATDVRTRVLKGLDIVVLQGEWRADGFVTPDGSVEHAEAEHLENAAIGWGLPALGRILTGHPGMLCTQKDAVAKPYCAPFGLQKTTLADAAGGDRMAAGLKLPATAPAFVLAGAVNPSDLLIPAADGSLLAEFKVCRDAGLSDCHFAYQVWKPASEDARLLVR